MAITTYLIPIAIVLILAGLYFARHFVVVPPHEAHVISGKGFKIYDGEGRYLFFPIFQTRNVLSKAVIEIVVPRIHVHDESILPFAIDISCKVQIGDARKAAETLGIATPEHIRPIVDDVIQSAARSQAMHHSLQTIMRDRDLIEQAIFTSTTDSLARLGVRVTLFDIKNIVDVEGSTVIGDLERVRSSEINRVAREAEATQISRAEIVEAQKKSEAEVQRQNAFRESEEARLKQEQFIAENRTQLTLQEMEVLSAETRRKAEIQREKVEIAANAEAEKQRLESQGRADSRLIEAKAEAESIKLKALADADSIRAKLSAEAEGTEKLAKALREFTNTGIAIKLAEINAEAQKIMSENIARGIQNNSKLFLPVGTEGLGNTLTSLIPSLTTLRESGVSFADLLKGEDKPSKSKNKNKST